MNILQAVVFLTFICHSRQQFYPAERDRNPDGSQYIKINL